ncbi:hypothetical protein NLJ89_g4300 [Agrocybe chaxingu]|uniref:GH16 domain-containing protein n=1 Tax=Agrocybe chaxingu TaxID=84603 RepID=A0A9W8K4A0_9AGAR|nr:hypothetical protein NLJ89_g4300 [Agrocybe chaxingu]
MKFFNSLVFPLLTLSTITFASLLRPYVLTNTIAGLGFFAHFDWQAIDDPTHGRVTYVDQKTAIQQNLTYASYDSFVLRTDSKTVLDPAGPGRNSVRIRSKRTYETHVAVFDVRHMPQGCGTWPAIWETKEVNWPDGGEIDILEGVNDQTPNSATIHTRAGCTMPETRLQTGTSGQLDCDWLVNFNTGCGVKFPEKTSYGPDFNANGGGWFAIERTDDHISVWFWDRQDKTVPRDVKWGTLLVDPKKWGIPSAHFPNTSCDFTQFFQENHIIINLTLCGDWAGNAYGATGCPSTCIDHVNSSPEAFTEAYFDIGSIRIYEHL